MFGKKANSAVAKVLRIGIVQDGKVVHERLVKGGQSVTIGESPRNTFVFASKSLPKRFTLFQAKGDGYMMNLMESMQGKMATQDTILDLDQIRAAGDATKKGDTWAVALKDGARGRVVLDNLTVLFQFVPAPPESARMANRQDFRPKLLDSDDPVFVGTMSLSLALASVLVIYAVTTGVAEVVTKEEARDRFVEMQLDLAEKEEEETTDVTDPDGDTIEKEEEAAEPPPEEKEVKERKPKTEEEKAAAEAARLQKEQEEAVADDPMLAAVFGTRGDTENDATVYDPFGDRDANIAVLGDEMDGASVMDQASTDNMGVKKGREGGREDGKIRDMERGEHGSGKVAKGPESKVVGRTKLSRIDTETGENDEGIRRALKARPRAQVQWCYEQSLKRNPSLDGRIELDINIVRGSVKSVSIVENTTNDKAIESCVKSKARGWTFPPVTEVITVPFALEPGS